jgi:hypothetical protein
MTDETLIQNPQPVEPPPPVPEIVTPAPSHSNKLPWIIAGCVGVLICLCCAACLALAVTAVGRIVLEKGPVEAVLNRFMEDMKAKDAEAAYSLFSPRSKNGMSMSELEKRLQGNNYVLFDGFESLSVQTLNVSASFNSDPDKPQGTIANVNGTINYEDGITGTFTAVLEKVDGEWMLYNVNITVPPDKFNL